MKQIQYIVSSMLLSVALFCLL